MTVEAPTFSTPEPHVAQLDEARPHLALPTVTARIDASNGDGSASGALGKLLDILLSEKMP